LSQGNIETELRKSAKIEQYGPAIRESGPNQNVSNRVVPYDYDPMKEMNPTRADKAGILGETSLDSVKEDIAAEKSGKTSSLVNNKTGEPLLLKQPPSARQDMPTIDDFDDDPGMDGYDPDSNTSSKKPDKPKIGGPGEALTPGGRKIKGNFNKGNTVSGNIVNKTTPDNPRQVSSGTKPSIVNEYNKAKNAGLDSARALKNAQRQAKLDKIKGKGKGKGKLVTTLLVGGLSAYIANQSDELDK
jgi:hypothetical protein